MLAYVHNVEARVDQRMIFQIWRPPYVHFSICESYFNCYALFGHQKGTSNNAFPNSWFILVFSLGFWFLNLDGILVSRLINWASPERCCEPFPILVSINILLAA